MHFLYPLLGTFQIVTKIVLLHLSTNLRPKNAEAPDLRFFLMRNSLKKMIDTIHFRLHNLEQNYSELYQWLLTKNQKSSKTSFDVNSKFTLLERTLTFMHNTGDAKEKFSAIVHNSPSSHYKIIIGVDLASNCINFNVSIPKYLYSTNVFQFLKHPQRDGIFFFTGVTDQPDFHADLLLRSLRRFLQIFFHKEFTHTKIYNQDIELTRIDLCFNQVFPSKRHALEYLEIMKEFKKKYLRKDSKVTTSYATSIFYSSKDYSYKIYHKGTEFEKNDLKEITRLIASGNKGLSSQALNDVKDFSDCILRYEMTFRQSYLSRIYHQHIFRVSVPQWMEFKKLNTKINYLIENAKFKLSNDNALKMIIRLRTNFFRHHSTLYLIKHHFDKDKSHSSVNKLPSENETIQYLRKFNKQMNRIISSKKYFFMDLHSDDLILYREDKNTLHNNLFTFEYARVSQPLLKKCWDIFMEHNISFQPKQGDTYNTAINKLREYNELAKVAKKYTGKSRIDESSFKQLLLLLNIYSFDKVCELLNYDRKTKYRYKQKLKLLGLDDKTIMYPLPYQPDLDYYKYFQEMTLHKYKYDKFFKIILDF